jgi:hypothetical protein
MLGHREHSSVPIEDLNKPPTQSVTRAVGDVPKVISSLSLDEPSSAS